MRKAEVALGKTYIAKVSSKLTIVRLDRESPHGGWDATNVKTGRSIRIRTAARLRKEHTSHKDSTNEEVCASCGDDPSICGHKGTM